MVPTPDSGSRWPILAFVLFLILTLVVFYHG